MITSRKVGFIRKPEQLCSCGNLPGTVLCDSARLQREIVYVPGSLHSDTISYISESIHLQEHFQINAFSMKTHGVLVWTERPIRIEMYALSNENVWVWTGSAAMRLNCLFPESFKSRVFNSRVFFSVKASINFAGDQLCAVRQWWGVCNSNCKVSWSAKRKLTALTNASFSEYTN